MEGLSTAFLIFLGIVLFNVYAEGVRGGGHAEGARRLARWFRAKFLNAEEEGTTATPAVIRLPGSTGLPPRAPESGAPGFLLPTAGTVCGSGCVFGASRDGGARRHEGLDLAAPTGTAVVAARGGKVTQARSAGKCGLMVVVDHGAGWTTRYCHLDRMSVRVSETVAAGAKVGEVGTTGNAAGGAPHLHFEIRHHGKALDPLPLLPIGKVA